MNMSGADRKVQATIPLATFCRMDKNVTFM